MKNIKSKLVEFYRDEEGASAIEYALVAAMVAVALVTFITPRHCEEAGPFAN